MFVSSTPDVFLNNCIIHSLVPYGNDELHILRHRTKVLPNPAKKKAPVISIHDFSSFSEVEKFFKPFNDQLANYLLDNKVRVF